MIALLAHLDELADVLRASADLHPADYAPAGLRDALAAALAGPAPGLAARLGRLDEWLTDALAEFVADAHALAVGLETAADDSAP
ncbi:MAG TPA: hypothetical protein VM597_27970 [Gemmataceae bacterium]|jgi:hypothetical protein|nr:hypothetical protein [Gemmataceae bacterium]